MTLIGLIGAILLPYQLFTSPSERLFTLLDANPYAQRHPQAEEANSPGDYSLAYRTPAPVRQVYRPQLTGLVNARVNWEHWLTTAAVAVVADGESPRPPGMLASGVAAPDFCHAYTGGGVSPAPVGVDPDPVTNDLFEVQVNQMVIGQVNSKALADRIASQLRQAVPAIKANPAGLKPFLGERAAGQLDGQIVFTLTDDKVTPSGPTALIATQWVDNLRQSFGAPPLEPIQVQMVAYGLGETPHRFNGTASWYGPYFHGRQTATGERFNQNALTAAHKSLPFGTYLKVRNQLNGKTVVVRVNDRGPYIGERSLDLSYAAAQCLGGEQVGVIPYEATVLEPGIPQQWRAGMVTALR